jgi:hypothetical protein
MLLDIIYAKIGTMVMVLEYVAPKHSCVKDLVAREEIKKLGL